MDPLIKSQLLYQLSYTPIEAASLAAPRFKRKQPGFSKRGAPCPPSGPRPTGETRRKEAKLKLSKSSDSNSGGWRNGWRRRQDFHRFSPDPGLSLSPGRIGEAELAQQRAGLGRAAAKLLVGFFRIAAVAGGINMVV